MERIIFPEIFGGGVKAFFTGKTPGVDLDRICRVASVEKGSIHLPIQRHTDKVHILDSDLEPKIADAVITREEGMLIGVQTADCVPVLLYDKVARVVGAVHAGWRGTAEEILRKTIRMMQDRLFSSPSNVAVAIGPSIRPCCYNVGPEVVDSVRRATGEGDYVRMSGDRHFIDLQRANRLQALSLGVPKDNIWISEDCTYCLPERYFSYRFAKGPTGRQAGFIGLV